MVRFSPKSRASARDLGQLGAAGKGKGTGIENRGKPNHLAMSFGCRRCEWRGTELCPHGKKRGESHTNNICSQRALHVKEYFRVAGNHTRWAQLDKLMTAKIIEDKLIDQFHDTGKLDPELAKHMRNSITLLNQMRRQDEGIKIQQENIVTIDKFREIVDAKYKELKGEKDGKENENNKGRS